MSECSYYAELVQTDPPDSPTPGSAHHAGEITGFATATEALAAAIPFLGKPVPAEHFHPCCVFQRPETVVTDVVVYAEDEGGNRDERNPIQAHLKEVDDE